jgi:hypothetical protein
MEEIPPAHLEFAAAQFPIRTQEEVIPKNAVLGLAQRPLANQAKVGRELLGFATPSASPILSRQRVQRYFAHVFLPAYAFAKMLQAGPEDGSQYAITGVRDLMPTDPQP